MQITGKTKILFILCDPVHHVRGTQLFNEQFLAEGIDAAFSPMHVTAEDLGGVVASIRNMRNVAGFGVTIPHKVNIIPLLDEVTEVALQMGCVNFVRREADGRLIGTNVDGAGFLRGLDTRGISVKGKNVLQFGAGGAGRAMAFATALDGAAKVTIWNRTAVTGQQVAEEIAQVARDCEVTSTTDPSPAGYDLVINATPVGMNGYPSVIIDFSALSPGAAVAEAIITPEATPLIIAAREQGLEHSIGRDMLLGQYQLMRDFIGLSESDAA